MNKICAKTGQYKTHYFVLTKDFLFLLKSAENPEIMALMRCEWVRVDYISKKLPNSRDILYCLRFIRNMRYTDLWTDSQSHYTNWRANLSKVFLQCDFHQKFNTIKMIGKGSFARVYLVEERETKQQFAVKAFSKEYLLS